MPTNKELEKTLNTVMQQIADMGEAVTTLVRSQAEAAQKAAHPMITTDDGSDMTEADSQMGDLIAQNQANPHDTAIVDALKKLAAASESNLYKRSAQPLVVTQKFTPENYSLKKETYKLAAKNGWEIIPRSWRAIKGEQFMFTCQVHSPYHKGSMPCVARWEYNEALDYWTPIIGISQSAKQHIQNRAHAGSKELNLKPGQRAGEITAAQARAMREGDDQFDDDGYDAESEVNPMSFNAE